MLNFTALHIQSDTLSNISLIRVGSVVIAHQQPRRTLKAAATSKFSLYLTQKGKTTKEMREDGQSALALKQQKHKEMLVLKLRNALEEDG